jgi:hypothetical protein
MRWNRSGRQAQSLRPQESIEQARAAVALAGVVLSLPPSAGAASRLMGRRALMLSLIAVTAADVTF